ncbi:MAG: hypothetical protein HOV87_26595 [Catenulispora sp.]|nr:hypothetical protein [Catenulispora sp.]
MTVSIVGFNLSHDSSVCLVQDGRIRAALALERTTRIKRGTVPLHVYAAAMADLTNDILAGEGLGPGDVDGFIATSTESRDAAEEARLASVLGLVVPAGRGLRLPHPGHHLAHASAAFYSSGFDEAAAVVIDAYGSRIGAGRERESAFLFRFGTTPEVVLREVRSEDRIAGRWRDGAIWLPQELSGIGEIYRTITLALGFRESATTYDDAGKTMGLASYGKRLSAQDLFIQTRPQGRLSFEGAADSLVELGLAVRQDGGLRLVPRPAGEPLEQFHRDLAAQVQEEFEQACLHVIDDVLVRTGSRSLVLSGGCFLNSTLNARVLRETEIDRLFVFPAATDDGNAAGAALYAYHHLLDSTGSAGPDAGGSQPGPALTHVFLGPPRVVGRDIEALAEQWSSPAHRHPSAADAARAAAAAIARGEIVGWFQNRAEFGPRALGARSILCHPGLPGMKDRLNARVKFREAFRPFAGSALAERAHKWFDIPAPDSPFMLVVCPVWPAQRAAISEIVHVDGTCRIQTVDPDATGPFRALLEAFEEETGLPVVLNTSFNLRGMPIVELPEQAIDCLFGSRLDRVFIGDVEVEAPDLSALRPERVGAAEPPAGSSPADLLLAEADGVRSMREIAERIGADLDATIDLALDLRRLGRLRWVGVSQTPRPTFPLPQYDPDSYGD